MLLNSLQLKKIESVQFFYLSIEQENRIKH